jgi:hypothetical protein
MCFRGSVLRSAWLLFLRLSCRFCRCRQRHNLDWIQDWILGAEYSCHSSDISHVHFTVRQALRTSHVSENRHANPTSIVTVVTRIYFAIDWRYEGAQNVLSSEDSALLAKLSTIRAKPFAKIDRLAETELPSLSEIHNIFTSSSLVIQEGI